MEDSRLAIGPTIVILGSKDLNFFIDLGGRTLRKGR